MEHAGFTKKGVDSLSQLHQVEDLDLDDVDLPPNSLGMIARMQGLKSLDIITKSYIDRLEIDELKSRLPKCAVEITSIGQ